jgi:hypothetical protein
MSYTDPPSSNGGGGFDLALTDAVMAAMAGAGFPVNRDQAAAIIREILTGRDDIEHPGQFVLGAIRRDPGRYTPGTHPKGKPKHAPHCGECDPHTRLVERADGRMQRCQNCHALRRQLLPQHARCDGCRAVIYRQDLGLPCGGKGAHRVAEEWQAEYDAAVERARIQREAEATAKADARARGEHVPEPDHGPDWDSTWGLHGEELARAQLEVARAGRLPERVNAAEPLELESGPHGDNPETARADEMPDTDPATGKPWPM